MFGLAGFPYIYVFRVEGTARGTANIRSPTFGLELLGIWEFRALKFVKFGVVGFRVRFRPLGRV